MTESVVIPADKTITLDLAGHTLSGGTAKGKAAITNNGALTIKDSSEDGSGRIIREDNGQPSYYVIDNQGTMTVESGTVYNNSGDYKSGSSLVRNGGVKNEAVLNIKGGTFEQEKFIVIKNDDYGILNMRVVSSRRAPPSKSMARSTPPLVFRTGVRLSCPAVESMVRFGRALGAMI